MNISKKDTIHTIAYFLDYGKYFGGAANTLLQQAVLMKKAGCATTIFLSDYYGRDMEPKYEKICTQYGIKILYETFQISSQPEDIDIICLDENYDTVKEKIVISNLSKKSLIEIETKITQFMMEEKKKYGTRTEEN